MQSSINRYQRNDYRHFSSVREFLEAAVPIAKNQSQDAEWAGGSFDDAVRYASNGDLEAVADASKRADQINDAVNLAGIRSEWSQDVVGAFPSVPAHLAGDPCSMWARSPVQDERGELDVYIDLAASVSASVQNMRRRGVCVLALLMALQRVRNVRAHLYTAKIGGNYTIDFSYPFDVSELAAYCGRPVVIRDLTYCFCEAISMEYEKDCVAWQLFGDVYPAAWSERVSGSRYLEIESLRQYANIATDALVINQGQMGALAGMSDADFVNHINGIIAAVNYGGDPNAATL